MPATEDHSISFRQIHTADGGRIRLGRDRLPAECSAASHNAKLR